MGNLFFPLQLQPLNPLSNTGPFGANIFDPRAWGNSSNPEEPINVITIEFTRVVLAIGVFAIGVELPKAYMVKHWKSLFFLLVPGMTWVRRRFFLILIFFKLTIFFWFPKKRVGLYALDSYTL